MSNLIAFRADPALKQRIVLRAAADNVAVSEFVRRAVEQALDAAPEPSLHDSIKHLIGSLDSVRGDLAERHDEIIEEELRADHDSRRHRPTRRSARQGRSTS